MEFIEKLEIDGKNKKNKPLRIVANRIIELLDKWREGLYGSDYFIFLHTFKVNIDLYKKGSHFDSETFDKIDEIMEMLSNPKQ